jgi:hypothetical protein
MRAVRFSAATYFYPEDDERAGPFVVDTNPLTSPSLPSASFSD